MERGPDSIWQTLGGILLCLVVYAAASSALARMRQNRLLPLDDRLRGKRNDLFLSLSRTWPFRDEYQRRMCTRLILLANLQFVVWSLRLAVAIAIVAIPYAYLRAWWFKS